MPAPARTPKRTEAIKSSGRIDVGQPRSPQNTATIRNRVLQWQAEWEINTDNSEEYGLGDDTQKRSSGRKTDNDKAISAPEDEELFQPSGTGVRHTSTPKKRVVSDENWKKNRALPKLDPKAVPKGSPEPAQAKFVPPFARLDPTSKKYDAWVRVRPRPKRSPKASDDDLPEQPEEPMSLRGRSISPSQTEKLDVEHWLGSVDSRGQKFYVTPSTSSRRNNANNASERRSPHNSKPASASSGETRKVARNRSRSRPGRRHVKDAQDDNASEWDQSSRAESVAEQDFTIPQTRQAPTPPVFGNRIQTWLTSTPDPFYGSVRPSSHDAQGAAARTEESPASNTLGVQTSSRAERGKYDDLSGKLKIISYVFSDPKIDVTGNHVLSDDDSKCSSPTSRLRRRGAKRNISFPKRQTCTASYMGDDKQHPETPSTNFVGDTFVSLQSASSTAPVAAPAVRYSSGHSNTRTALDDLQVPPRVPSRLPVVTENIEWGQAVPQVFSQESDLMYSFVKKPSMKQKLTSHADLISVLSLPRENTRSIRSARSLRTTRSKPGAITISEVMNEVKSDETKYARELRTLVDGVIPVLLNCAMSKTQSAKAGQLFGHLKSDANVAAPIVQIGIALERLKSFHERIALQSPDAFILWSQGAHRVYADYIQAWRMGFQDVVVNLADPNQDKRPNNNSATSNSSWRDTLPRNEEGYVVDDDGEKVDVAFLLKRPLVRLRYLARSLENIFHASGSSQAKTWTAKYQDLVSEARQKQEEERARLEDEAASAIDATRSRELQSLAPLAGVQINPTPSVRARDFFDLRLKHSSGQQMDCRVEMFIRGDRGDVKGNGDVLICEIDSVSRWLLFPPIPISRISARNENLGGEISVTITGTSPTGQSWRECLSLRSDDEQVGFDWVHMLGLSPVSPEHEFLEEAPITHILPFANHSGAHVRQSNVLDATLPIGEQASDTSKRWNHQAASERRQESNLEIRPEEDFEHDHRRGKSLPLISTLLSDTNRNAFPTRTQAQQEASIQSPMRERQGDGGSSPYDRHQVRENDASSQLGNRQEVQRPVYGRISSTPSNQPPLVPKSRATTNDYENTLPTTSTIKRKEIISPKDLTNIRGRAQVDHILDEDQPHSYTPLYSPPSVRIASTPHFGQRVKQNDGYGGRRRASSPLKHQYQPSSTSGDSSTSDDSSDDDRSASSESSTDNVESTTLPVSVQLAMFGSRTVSASTGPGSIAPSQSASQRPYSDDQMGLNVSSKSVASIFSWSEKGIWESLFPGECSIIVSPGLIEAFETTPAHSHTSEGIADRPEIAKPARTDPLVALELTPLVPLRRGTAIDISIRSPPTANSQIRSSNNVMFRSRNGQECEALYNMINHARINNPTYIAMQDARSPNGAISWAAHMDRRGNKRNPSSWWRFGTRRNSYRSKGPSRPQSIAQTESSVDTMSTAISTLKRYSASGSRMFSMGKPTNISQGQTERSSSSFTSSSGASTPVVEAFKQELSLGITNAKIRLYQRETASKWQDKGPARLTIMHPPQEFQANMSPGRTRQEKRIVVTGKTHDQPLLDVTLGETSFERVARTGIAVSVWEHLIGPNGEVGQASHTGGVVGTRVKVYMIQMKSEAETAYTFSLVGRSRY